MTPAAAPACWHSEGCNRPPETGSHYCAYHLPGAMSPCGPTHHAARDCRERAVAELVAASRDLLHEIHLSETRGSTWMDEAVARVRRALERVS